MKTSELIFIGIRGSVIALDRSNGQIIWTQRLKGYDFVNVIVENHKIFASAYGEMFCLDPLTGRTLWHNPLKGYGVGLAAIATDAGAGSGSNAVLAEREFQSQSAANSTPGM